MPETVLPPSLRTKKVRNQLLKPSLPRFLNGLLIFVRSSRPWRSFQDISRVIQDADLDIS